MVVPTFAQRQGAPSIRYTGPIIDVHLHTEPPPTAVGVPNPVTKSPGMQTSEELRDATLKECARYGIVRAVLNAWPGTEEKWLERGGKTLIWAPMVLKHGPNLEISLPELREALSSGRVKVLGELLNQYTGQRFDDPHFEGFWKLAEEFGIPVIVHTGTSFAGTAYAGFPKFRLALGNPLLLEEVLVRFPKVRICLAHGGEPWREATIALMRQYPQLYADVGTISWMGGPAGRAGFHDFLEHAFRRGLGKRILFGSDQMAWPDAIGLAIEGVDSAEFLSDEQKRDIFYNNSIRFLGLKQPLE